MNWGRCPRPSPSRPSAHPPDQSTTDHQPSAVLCKFTPDSGLAPAAVAQMGERPVDAGMSRVRAPSAARRGREETALSSRPPRCQPPTGRGKGMSDTQATKPKNSTSKDEKNTETVSPQILGADFKADEDGFDSITEAYNKAISDAETEYNRACREADDALSTARGPRRTATRAMQTQLASLFGSQYDTRSEAVMSVTIAFLQPSWTRSPRPAARHTTRRTRRNRRPTQRRRRRTTRPSPRAATPSSPTCAPSSPRTTPATSAISSPSSPARSPS